MSDQLLCRVSIHSPDLWSRRHAHLARTPHPDRRLPRPLHGRARQPRGLRRARIDPPRPRLLGPVARMDRQRLHALLRRLPARRRDARRPLRPPARLPLGPRHIHGRVRVRRARARHRHADRRTGDSGHRRRRRHAADADAARRDLRRRAARPRAGSVVGNQRNRRRARPARRRRGHRRAELALDLWHQRPDRAGADPGRRAHAAREPRPQRSTRRARPRAQRGRAAGHRVRAGARADGRIRSAR